MAAGADDDAGAGQELADWLDGLGLADQLAAAGLPTFERSAGGTATWRDPGSGEPLSATQVADLDRVLHRQGEEPQHAVPVALVQLTRLARVRAELVAEPWHDYAGLAALRGRSVPSTRFAVHKAASTHRLLVVPGTTTAMVPAFQLDDDGEVRPELLAVLEPLLSAGMDPWRLWGWLARPAGLLGGLVPERAAADPDEVDLVVRAAIRLAERV